MKDKQLEMLKALLKKLESENRTKSAALETFVNAGILNRKGNFTKHYSDLEKLIPTIK
jgi:hypothetical protein